MYISFIHGNTNEQVYLLSGAESKTAMFFFGISSFINLTQNFLHTNDELIDITEHEAKQSQQKQSNF